MPGSQKNLGSDFGLTPDDWEEGDYLYYTESKKKVEERLYNSRA